ncbi:hypothetical protein RFI_01625, partial [Reticulomyxa filosa]
MSSQNTARKQKQIITTSTPFQDVKNVSSSFALPQCVRYKRKILICKQRACYSYHTLKNEYKFVCEYPHEVKLFGHCVLKLEYHRNNKDSNGVTLLSFGGKHNHTLVIKYISDIKRNKSKNHNYPIQIGRKQDDYEGVRAVIDGSNNHLLFITYYKNNISVFDLNVFQFIKHDKLPAIKKWMSTRNDEMLLFCKKIGLSIEYDESNILFQFRQLPVCSDIASFNEYAYWRMEWQKDDCINTHENESDIFYTTYIENSKQIQDQLKKLMKWWHQREQNDKSDIIEKFKIMSKYKWKDKITKEDIDSIRFTIDAYLYL